ncbi:BCS1 N terminal-domain-containing protein [Geopyxis carbonaria]|nr:BCS1 N terminal-domain-containing protein [Geopyxis carbonaria]
MSASIMSSLGFKQSPSSSKPTVNGDDSQTQLKNVEASPGVFASLGDNPLFTGGLAIAALTTGFQVIRKSSTRAASLLRRHMLLTVEIPSSDPSYEWFLHFLAEHHRKQSIALKTSQLESVWSLSGLISRVKPAPRELSVETRTHKTASGASVTDFVLVPGQGKHLISYSSTFFQVSRQRDSKRINLPSGTPFETLEVTTLYTRRGVLSDLLRESQQMALRRSEGKTTVYNSWGTEWRPFGNPLRKRPLDSVVLAPGVKEKVIEDLSDFLNSSDWYRDRGIPYRRGYLLYGPPGTGKTSFVKAMAGYLDYNICMINLSERGLTDDRLNHLLSNLPERSIALLEDVDAAFANRTQTAEDGYRGANVTFSGLLNSLDGAASGENRIIVLTTNHPDRLDGALLRPGRVDLKVEIGYATPEMVNGMWSRFYGPDTLPDNIISAMEANRLREELLDILRSSRFFDTGTEGISTAELQGLFLSFKNDPIGAIAEAKKIVSGLNQRL